MKINWTPNTPNVYFWTPNSEILAKALGGVVPWEGGRGGSYSSYNWVEVCLYRFSSKLLTMTLHNRLFNIPKC